MKTPTTRHINIETTAFVPMVTFFIKGSYLTELIREIML